MVCIACLLPIFLLPLVNILPRLFDFFMAKFYGVFRKDYRPPVRVPAQCPIPSARKEERNENDSTAVSDDGAKTK